jgi:hypothetical protein
MQGGRAHWLRAFIYPVTDQGGSVCEVMILFEDVTAQEESCQLLEQRVAERTRELSSLLEVSRNVTATLDLQTLSAFVGVRPRPIIPRDHPHSSASNHPALPISLLHTRASR